MASTAHENNLASDSYWSISRRPLQMLFFLLPLIIAYEIALAAVLRQDNGVYSNLAHLKLLQFFEFFRLPQTSGLYLGGLAIILVLLAWHVLAHHPWRIRMDVFGGMILESALLVLPLLLLHQVLAGFLGTPPGPAAAAAGPIAFEDHDVWTRLSISIGAGLYEELVFRMLLIAAVHTLLVDALKASEGWAIFVALVVSASAFTIYHPIAEDPLRTGTFLFLAGVYFGFLFIARGFGIVVAVHALYDIVTVVTSR